MEHLIILGTSDLHAALWGYSYESDTETPEGSLANVCTYVEEVRKEGFPVLLLDAGDAIQGTVTTDVILPKAHEGIHPVMAAMNAVGYSAMAIGNHEFNFGLDRMKEILSQASFPVLSANVLTPEGEYYMGKGWEIFHLGGVRVAVIGVVTPDVPLWEPEDSPIRDLVFLPANKAVAKAISEIGGNADVFVVSAHMGLAPEMDEENGSDSGERIILDNPEVDVLQVGHLHIKVKEKVGKALVGGCRNDGREVARFDLYVEDGKVVDSTLTIVDMRDYRPSGVLRNLPEVKKAHEETLVFSTSREEGRKVGSSLASFQKKDEIPGIPDCVLHDTPLPDFINRIQRKVTGADVSATALYNTRANLPEGSISFSDVFAAYKFSNLLFRVEMNGRDLKTWMEWSQDYYNTWRPGDVNVSIDNDVPYFLHDHFLGVEYTVDLSKEKGHRLGPVYFHGSPLKDDQMVTVAVTSYRYTAILKGVLKLESVRKLWDAPLSVREYIFSEIEESSPLDPKSYLGDHWKITGIDLQEDDPRRGEVLSWIREGRMASPVYKAWNMKDYEETRTTLQEAGTFRNGYDNH